MPLLTTKGAGSASSLGITSASGPANYIEDVFSCFLYTGTGAAQTITNNIDLSTKGGLVWTKYRNAAYWHTWFDTVRGNTKVIYSNSTSAQDTLTDAITSFNSTGYTLGTDSNGGNNYSGGSFVSWTFRKQPKFFDVVTYTGNGVDGRQLPHNLGSTPGCVMFKRTDSTGRWITWHRSLSVNYYLQLQDTAGQQDYTKSLTPDATNLTLQTVSNSPFNINESGATYVAYLFAHDAGGFGLSGTDNVISCGLTTADASGNFSATIGYEPQWILMKSTSASRWSLFDNMRGVTASSGYTSSKRLNAHTSEVEDELDSPYGLGVNATGFTGNIGTFSNDWIYIAIRRGPMKVPTLGTSVYNAIARTGTGATATITAGFPYDWLIAGIRNLAYGSKNWDRLRGITNPLLNTTSTAAEYTGSSNSITAGTQNGLTVGADSDWTINYSSANYINWFFRRSPSVFDIVCYTGDGTSNSSVNHNLGVVPELFFVKRRNAGGSGDVNWGVYSKDRPSIAFNLILNSDTGWYNAGTNGWFGTGTLSSTLFPSGNASANFGNLSGGTYVAYLFATCAGVSKVGSYTGTGALQTINCGFTGGARFVLIKRTDSTGNWWVYDSTRGITSGNDPYYLLNLNDAEVTNTNYVDTDSTGFKVTAAAPAELNANGGTFIFLAIA